MTKYIDGCLVTYLSHITYGVNWRPRTPTGA